MYEKIKQNYERFEKHFNENQYRYTIGTVLFFAAMITATIAYEKHKTLEHRVEIHTKR